MLNYVETIKRLGMTDQLTDLPNRRSFEERMRLEWGRAMRDRKPISLLMIDIDEFKRYNDTYGHQQGDMVLRTVASLFVLTVKRSVDFIARLGGEEFVIVLPNTDLTGANLIAEKLLDSVRNLNIPHKKSTVASYVTISIGVTSGIVNHLQNGSDYVKRADEMLFVSKKNGRNRISSLEMTAASPMVLS